MLPPRILSDKIGWKIQLTWKVSSKTKKTARGKEKEGKMSFDSRTRHVEVEAQGEGN